MPVNVGNIAGVDETAFQKFVKQKDCCWGLEFNLIIEEKKGKIIPEYLGENRLEKKLSGFPRKSKGKKERLEKNLEQCAVAIKSEHHRLCFTLEV